MFRLHCYATADVHISVLQCGRRWTMSPRKAGPWEPCAFTVKN